MLSFPSNPLVEKIIPKALAKGREGIHGPSHWLRVERNGLFLTQDNGGDPLVLSLFAFLHDVCRYNDFFDPHHGPRAAKWLHEMVADGELTLDDETLRLLSQAIEGHTLGKVSPDPTIGACWDADRLDLPRVGKKVRPRFLSTQRARDLLSHDPHETLESLPLRDLN